MPEERVDLSLRPATRDDEAFLLEVYASTRMEELAGLGWDEQQKQAFIKMQFVARERSFACGDHRIVLLNERPIGRLLVDRTDTEILLKDIAFLPQYRNAGIGTRLIEDLKKEATSRRKPITLHVVASSPAVRLYERLGFQRRDAKSAYETAYLDMHWVPSTN